jgi:uncharacterized membrane protein YfcA
MPIGEMFLDVRLVLLIAVFFFALAALYSSVGHGGASGYLAVMALFDVPMELMRPVALTLNIFVASLTMCRFYKSGYLSWSDIWPLVLLSIPCAFVGGSITLPTDIYRPILGALLLTSAVYLFWDSIVDTERFSNDKPEIPRLSALGVGGTIGMLSGLTGIGGGVILSPTLLILRWTNVRRTSAIAASFILVNSTAGLAGNVVSLQHLPIVIPVWVAAALVGGYIGSKMGSQLLAPKILVRLLALALVVAGLKFLLT